MSCSACARRVTVEVAMSWDVMIFDFGGKTPPVDEIQEADMAPLGPADEVRRRIAELPGGVDWSDPMWGLYRNDGYSIEFSVGEEEPVTHMMLHVRGGGDAIAAIIRFA